MYVCIYVCMCVCMRVCMYVCMHACMYVYMYACIYMYVCVYVCMCKECTHSDGSPVSNFAVKHSTALPRSVHKKSQTPVTHPAVFML